MHTIKKGLDKSLEFICMILMVLMTSLVTWQVFTRYVLNNPSTTSEILAKYLFIWLVLYGAAYVFGLKEHMAITFVKDKLPLKVQYIMDILIELMIGIFAGCVMVQGGWESTIKQMAQMDSTLQVPMGVIYSAIPISGVIVIFYGIYNILGTLKKFQKEV